MIINHNDYLFFDIPRKWCAEYNDDDLLVFHPKGSGAMTLSFLSTMYKEEELQDQISAMAKGFVEQNDVMLHAPLTLSSKGEKVVVCGSGTMPDGWFVKVWIAAQYPKIVFATYHSEKKTREIKFCDTIIDSFSFRV